MSQNDLVLANQAGAAFRADLNSALGALASLSSGATAPGTTYPFQLWQDTTANVLKIRNAANTAWIIVDSPADTTKRAIWLNGTEAVTIKSTGVGIAQTTPAHALDVNGDINVTGNFLINGTPLSFTIGANSISWGQLETAAANTVIGRPSSTSGDVSEIAIGANRLFGRGASGDIGPITLGTGLVFSGSALNADVGTTAGKLVQLDGSAKLPAVDGSQLTNLPNGLVLLENKGFVSTTSIDFNTGFDNTKYDNYLIVFGNSGGNSSSNFYLYTKDSASAGAYRTSGYTYNVDQNDLGTTTNSNSNSAGQIKLMQNGTFNTGHTGVGGEIRINSPATRRATFNWDMYFSSSTNNLKVSGGGSSGYQADITAIRLVNSTGNINGTFALYGVKKT